MMQTLATAVAFIGGVTLLAGNAAAATPAQCDYQARQYADTYVNPAGNVVGGAATGALIGGIASAIFGGNVGTGIVAGAVGGGVVGAVGGSAEWMQLYDQAYYECINVAARPLPVLTCPILEAPSGYDDGYLVGSPQWIAACDHKYRTFEPRSWMFNGYDGCTHFCNL